MSLLNRNRGDKAAEATAARRLREAEKSTRELIKRVKYVETQTRVFTVRRAK